MLVSCGSILAFVEGTVLVVTVADAAAEVGTAVIVYGVRSRRRWCRRLLVMLLLSLMMLLLLLLQPLLLPLLLLLLLWSCFTFGSRGGGDNDDDDNRPLSGMIRVTALDVVRATKRFCFRGAMVGDSRGDGRHDEL